MKPIFFVDQYELRVWFEKNHKKEKELLIGYYKKDSGRASVTWPESVDQALCFGWIDGIRKKIDEISYTIRFTPRNPKSNWSAINIEKVKNLTRLGLMKDAGLEVFNNRDVKKSKLYSFERENVRLDKNYEIIFKKKKKAWDFFNLQVKSYQKPALHWIMSAKQESTRFNRLKILIDCSSRGEKIPPLRRNLKDGD